MADNKTPHIRCEGSCDKETVHNYLGAGKIQRKLLRSEWPMFWPVEDGPAKQVTGFGEIFECGVCKTPRLYGSLNHADPDSPLLGLVRVNGTRA